MAPLGVGFIGCGNISAIYLQNCLTFENLRVVGVSDLDASRAKQKAADFGTRAYAIEDILIHPDAQIIVNLTVPSAHAHVNRLALEYGKHIYTEKPFGITRQEGVETLDLARQKDLKTAGAPDTFLGSGLQTCRRLIDQGTIGRPVSAVANMLCHGHEHWHPHPEFFYQAGGGPMLDMGPYYLSALTALIGPVRKVSGMVDKGVSERTITAERRSGVSFPVEIPTHIAGQMQFEGGAVGTIITSFDVWQSDAPLLEIHGTEGSLSVPDPNTFGGAVRLFTPAKGWEEIPLELPYRENSRGLGVSDLAAAIEDGRSPRASGELCFHVLDVMLAFEESSRTGRHIEITSGVDRPDPLV